MEFPDPQNLQKMRRIPEASHASRQGVSTWPKLSTSEFLGDSKRPLSSDGMRPKKVFLEEKDQVLNRQKLQASFGYDRKRHHEEVFIRDVDEPMVCKVTGYYFMRDGVEKNVIFGAPEDPSIQNGDFFLAFHVKDKTAEIKQLRPLESGGYTYFKLFGREFLTKPNGDVIHPLDLVPGKKIDLFDKSFIITDCDSRTKSYFGRVFGVHM